MSPRQLLDPPSAIGSGEALNVWIFNPFDELPTDTDMRHRYWTLAATLSDMGHHVIWWSSDWSHRRKARRITNRGSEKFELRLIPTRPYRSNVSLARLRNHRDYAKGLLKQTTADIREGNLTVPDRIVCSLPPLGSPLVALQLRSMFGGKVILDYMDAWPETFYRVLPVPDILKPLFGRVLFYPWHKAATRCVSEADKISGVSETYLRLAASIAPGKDQHLCYHGIDLEGDAAADNAWLEGKDQHFFKVVFIGALERSYDLKTAIETLRLLNNEGYKVELHVAGAGAQQAALLELTKQLPWLYFHGLLQRQELRRLLLTCHAGLIPMKQDSWVGLPYKLADYCASGLAILSSLDGPCRDILVKHDAGLFYQPGSQADLRTALLSLIRQPARVTTLSANSRQLAQSKFNRDQSYPAWAKFILS
ncbi:MAG: glycosyltransferase [Verrucomicrobia bacterium]|nr:glycosyltransferase [Verrucomicrobiota bacterium]